ncbi:hypothetical protein CQY22_013135 [Mycolicibacterium brumae]|uniref:Uncharacterized protein n=2 Tax=Mycolicibacterium brumae TaxID=85968 RepID=A0A2G5P7R4_9MYCO|nr:hypothetical protein CQY22_013135 [Mycolicibacterium brumae]RWA22735.1 hypothetical protein MBRU_12355 [Mycolicibacterium brumae DSM 44177]
MGRDTRALIAPQIGKDGGMDARRTAAEVIGADQIVVSVGLTKLVLTAVELQGLRVELDAAAGELGLPSTAGALEVKAALQCDG